MTVETLLMLLRGEFSSLHISYNEHSSYYEKPEDCESYSLCEWVSEEERLKAYKENSVWTIQWYPNTPISCNFVGASTFEAVANYALQVYGEMK